MSKSHNNPDMVAIDMNSATGPSTAEPALASEPVAGASRSPKLETDAPLPTGPTHDAESTGSDGEEEAEEDTPSSPSKQLHKVPSTRATLVLDIVLSALILVPAALLYFFAWFPTYNLQLVKGPFGLNPMMEMVRWSLFISVAYLAYGIFNWSFLMLPTIINRFVKFSRGTSKRTRKYAEYLKATHSYFATALLLLFMVIVGGFLIYQSTLLGPTPTPTPTATPTGSPPGPPASANPVAAGYFFERTLVVLFVLAIVLTIEKGLIWMIANNFHRQAFAERIHQINAKFEALRSLYKACTQGSPVIVTAIKGGRLRRYSTSVDSPGLASDTGLALTSEQRAKTIATRIFHNLAKGGVGDEPEYLVPDDFRACFPPNQYEAAFAMFDVNGNRDISENEFRESVIDLYHQRENVARSIHNNGRIVRKLDRILLVIAMFIGAALAMPFYDLGIGKAWATFGLVSTGFGFMFQNAGKTFFEALLFIFIEHAFDVGDRVSFDGENLVVDNIEIFTTRFIRWDGLFVYCPNSILSNKAINNVRRSGFQSETVEIHIPANIPSEKLWELKDKIYEYLTGELEQIRQFTGFVDYAGITVVSAEKMTVQVMVQYKANFQDQQARNARHNDFMLILRKAQDDLGIPTVA